MKQDALPLTYTPRKLLSHPTQQLFYTIESDHRVYSPDIITQKLKELVRVSLFMLNFSLTLSFKGASKADREALDIPPEIFGRPRAPAGNWASCIRIIDPIQVRQSAPF